MHRKHRIRAKVLHSERERETETQRVKGQQYRLAKKQKEKFSV